MMMMIMMVDQSSFRLLITTDIAVAIIMFINYKMKMISDGK